MRWLSWIVMLPLAAAVIVFSVSNRAVTQVDFWPFGYIVELPVFGIVLSSLLLGFMLGGFIAWLSHAKKRSEARAATRVARNRCSPSYHPVIAGFFWRPARESRIRLSLSEERG